MSRCLRCGATSEWIEGKVKDEPPALMEAAKWVLETRDRICHPSEFLDAIEALRAAVGSTNDASVKPR